MSIVIEEVKARKIFNSRGEETIEVDVYTTYGFGRASAPSGASRGEAEAVPYPEGGVDQAIKKVESLIAPELVGVSVDEQEEIDLLLRRVDGTNNFGNIGGNTACAVSLAVADAAAVSFGIPLFQHLGGYLASELPYPLGNVLGGGKHARGKAPDVQEFLVLPVGAESFMEAMKANVSIHEKVGSLLPKKDKTFTGGRTDEGAWCPSLGMEDSLETVLRACEETFEELGVECRIGLDMAASTLWNHKEERYVYARDGVKKDSREQLDFVLSLIKMYNLVYVEDPFHEKDFKSFVEVTKRAENCLICGDDLFSTNTERLSQGVKMGAANSIIIKVNQVGSLSDAWETTKMAKDAGYVPVMSHRSGETNDPHIAHLAVAFHCPIIKTGIVGGERAVRLNELIRIEEMLGGRAKMAVLTF